MTRRVVDERQPGPRVPGTRRPLLALLAAAALLAACAPASRQPAAEIASVTPIADVFGPRFDLVPGASAIERFDPPGAGAGLGVSLTTTVRNPNDFAITVERIDYALVVRGRSVARAVLEPDLLLEPGATQTLSWTVVADLTDQRELWRPVVDAFAGTPLAFSVDGSVRFTTETYAFTTGSRTLVAGAVLATQAVASPRLRLDGRESRLTVVRADAPVVSLVLFAHNGGDVGYFLSGRDLSLELNGEVVARLDLGPVPVPAGETGRVDLVFIVDRTRLSSAAGEALDRALFGERADVVLRGAFAYDVLGVDSYAADIGDALTVSLPLSQLPGLTRAAPVVVPAPTEDTDDEGADDGADDGADEGADDGADEGAADGDGATDDGATDDGAADDGATDDGATDGGETDDGAADDAGEPYGGDAPP